MSDNWRTSNSSENRYSRGRTTRNSYSRDNSDRQNKSGYNSSYSNRSNNHFGENTDYDDAASASWGDIAIEKPTYQRRTRNANDINISIDVPSNKIGKIIGRGGSKIRELQDESQTEIKVKKNSEDENTGMSKVQLIGSETNVLKAQQLIEDLCNDQSNTDKYKSNDRNKKFESQTDNTDDFATFNWQELNRICEEETKAFWAKLPDIVKDFYIEDPTVAKLTPKQVAEIRAKNNNTTVGYVFENDEHKKPIPNPVLTFQQCFKHYPEIMDGIERMGFDQPSPIQAQAWPVLLSGQDLIGIAQTGTGKTLAFLLPALIHIEGQTTPRSERSGPTVLILAPTRELAQQIEREVIKYNYKDMKVVCLYGGGSRKEQVAVCTEGVEIVIATPGRLSDLTVAGHIDMKSVSYLVLDEADRMLDLGFEPQIRKIMVDIRPNRQTVMTSATWPPGVRRLAQSYTQDPIQVCIGTLDLAAVHSVTQTIAIIEDSDEAKYEELRKFIDTMDEDSKVIVFCGRKARVDHLASDLALAGINCQTIHGDLEQSDREQALVDIASGEVQILIATDVASRGIDICDISHVINYDFPRNVEEYVHRVGRTGRAGRTGESISFVTRGDWANAKELISILEEANQSIPPELYDMKQRFEAMQERRQKEREVLRGTGGGGRYNRGGGGRGGFRNNSHW